MRAEELARAFKAKWWRLGKGWNPSLDEADIAALLQDANSALLKELKRNGTHSVACAIKAVGGYPARWIDSESRRCTCSLGETIRKAESP